MGGGVMPKIETNSREEMGIQVKLNRGIQREAKRGVTGVTEGRLRFCHASNYDAVKATRTIYENICSCMRVRHRLTATVLLSNSSTITGC